MKFFVQNRNYSILMVLTQLEMNGLIRTIWMSKANGMITLKKQNATIDLMRTIKKNEKYAGPLLYLDAKMDYDEATEELFGDESIDTMAEFMTAQGIYYVGVKNTGDEQSVESFDMDGAEYC